MRALFPCIAVRALGASGQVLGASAPVAPKAGLAAKQRHSGHAALTC